MRAFPRLLIAGLLAASASARPATQQTANPPVTTIMMPPGPILPDKIGTLTAADAIRKPAAALPDVRFDRPGCDISLGEPPMVEFSGPTPAVLKEDGLVRLEAANYAGAGGAKASVSGYEFVDATGAEAAYSFCRSTMRDARIVGADARPGHKTTETSANADGTLIWAGTALLSIHGRLSAADTAALVAGLPKASGSKSLPPLLPSFLPAEVDGVRLEAGSIRYAVGPAAYQAMGGVLPAEILGWEKNAESATATYAGRGRTGTLTLLIYPTPQIAGDRGRAIEQAANQLGTAKLGTVKLRRIGPLVGMTSGNLEAAQAEKLVQALNLNEEITFDKKMPLEFHTEVRKTATLLEQIAYFVGVLIIAALVIGVFLGGARAGIRKLRGKSAASEPEFLTINLRDQPKALFAEKPSDPKQIDEVDRTPNP